MVEVRQDYVSSADEAAYSEFVSTASTSLFQHTLVYRDLLAATTECEPIYILARTNGRIVGALPLFLEQNDRFGNVLNSLPFFGSPGGMLVNESLDTVTQEAAQKVLVTALEQAMARHNCVTATLLTSQIDPRNTEDGHPIYEQYLPYKYKEQRTAQVVNLQRIPSELERVETPPATTPQSTADADTIGEHLFTLFEKRCRRAIRKPYKQGLEVKTSTADFAPLFRMHKQGMESKGGRVKPRSFFESIPDIVPAEQYDLLYARKNGTIIAGLLLFYDGNTVEYYTPAYEFEHRDDQATSMLIFEAMKKAVSDGFQYWNFGGTLSSQESLHRFKRGWGADDYPYHYYTVSGDDIETLLAAPPKDVAASYGWSYVIPFDALSG
jgi:CelD/BcsL family acetyltransferase involved in cellulose biosynthesis